MKVLQNGWFAGGSLDGTATSAAGVRYRFNVYRTFDTCAVALRRLDSRFRTFDESVIETGGINGMVTLVFAHGAGAGAMRGIGICTSSGMLAATVFGICFTLALYALFERMRKSTLRSPHEASDPGRALKRAR